MSVMSIGSGKAYDKVEEEGEDHSTTRKIGSY